MGIDHKSAFNWWVTHVLKKRDQIISVVAKRSACYLKHTHKFGIETPKTPKEALELDRNNDNTPLTQMTNNTARVVTYCAFVEARPLTVQTASLTAL